MLSLPWMLGMAAAGTEAVKVTHDVAYARAGGRDLLLDLYEPAGGPGPFPAVVCLHGGGMVEGDRSEVAPYAAYLAERGFVAANAAYRLAGEARYPASIHDCKAAVRWLRAHAGRLRVDPERIGALGSSAGGYLAGMLATTAGLPEFDGPLGETGHSTRVQAALLLAPGADLLLRARLTPPDGITVPYTLWLGAGPAEDPERWQHASPITHVSRDSAPILLLHAAGDPVTPYAVSEAMLRACRQAGVPAELEPADSTEHGFWNLPQWTGFVQEHAAGFFARYLGPIH